MIHLKELCWVIFFISCVFVHGISLWLWKEQQDMIRACTDGDVLMLNKQKAEVCESGSESFAACLLQNMQHQFWNVCFISVEAGFLRKSMIYILTLPDSD